MSKTILFLLLLSLPSFGFVDYRSQNGNLSSIFEGPSSVALGGAGLAAKSSNESGHTNPATLPLLDGTHFGFIYGAESAGDRAGANKYHLVLSEATDEVAFPGALTVTRATAFRHGKDVSIQEIHGAVGFEVSNYLSVGTAAKYLSMDGYNMPSTSAFNTTLGLLITPMRSLGFALLYDDFMETKDIPMNSTIGIGGQYVFERVIRIRADGILPLENNASRGMIYKAGFESLFLGRSFNVRLGHRWDNYIGARYVTAGIGWQGPKLGLNYAFEKASENDDSRHLIDMLLQF